MLLRKQVGLAPETFIFLLLGLFREQQIRERREEGPQRKLTLIKCISRRFGLSVARKTGEDF